MKNHLQSMGLLSRLREPTTTEGAVWPAIKDVLESMGEMMNVLKEEAFQKITPKAVFALSPGYAHLEQTRIEVRVCDGLKFVYAIVVLLSEGNIDVIISAPNREVGASKLRQLRAELPAVWSDISSDKRGFKEHLLHMLVLNEVLRLELTEMSNDLWFRGIEIQEEGEKRQNCKETKVHLGAMVLRRKPGANRWLHLTHRIAALGIDVFVKELNLAENAGKKSAE